jgi:hypothetical protein
MNKGIQFLQWICGLLLLLGIFVYTSHRKYISASRVIQARLAVVQTLGISSLALSDECSSTRNPLEGLCGSMSDIPGSYLYHTDCDLVNPSFFPPESRYHLKVKPR